MYLSYTYKLRHQEKVLGTSGDLGFREEASSHSYLCCGHERGFCSGRSVHAILSVATFNFVKQKNVNSKIFASTSVQDT